MASDLITNLIHGLYSLFAHNGEVIAYVFGALITVAALIFRPTRQAVLYLLAFGILAFNFEYDKHIMIPLREQTVATIVANPETHLYTQRLLNLFLTDLLPVIFFIAGWGLLFLAITLSLTTPTTHTTTSTFFDAKKGSEQSERLLPKTKP